MSIDFIPYALIQGVKLIGVQASSLKHLNNSRLNTAKQFKKRNSTWKSVNKLSFNRVDHFAR